LKGFESSRRERKRIDSAGQCTPRLTFITNNTTWEAQPGKLHE
jgi:hypothetical protein